MNLKTIISSINTETQSSCTNSRSTDSQIPGEVLLRFSGNWILLPPERKLGQGNVFTSICHSVQGGSVTPWADTPSPSPGRHTSGRHTPGQTPLGGHTPRQIPPGDTLPLGRHPPAQYMLGYGKQAGGTHPTGMHSC